LRLPTLLVEHYRAHLQLTSFPTRRSSDLEVEDEEDLALLEARDLLFARLLQYRAYKEVAKVFAARMAEEALRYPRQVPMEPQFAGLLPELVLGVGPEGLARIAARAFAPKRPPTVSTEHIYQPRASVREQAAILVARLRRVRKRSEERRVGKEGRCGRLAER